MEEAVAEGQEGAEKKAAAVSKLRLTGVQKAAALLLAVASLGRNRRDRPLRRSTPSA